LKEAGTTVYGGFPGFPLPVSTRTCCARMIRLRRTEGLVVDSPQDEG
jgi:hypothetical protein